MALFLVELPLLPCSNMAGLLDHLQISLEAEHRYLGAALAVIDFYGLVILFSSRVQRRTSSSPRIMLSLQTVYMINSFLL